MLWILLALPLLGFLAGTARPQSKEKGQEEKAVATRSAGWWKIQDLIVDLGGGPDYGWETVSGGGIVVDRSQSSAASIAIENLTFSGPCTRRAYLADWLDTIIEGKAAEDKLVIVWAMKSDGQANTETGYQGCLPVRYVFPKLEYGVHYPIVETAFSSEQWLSVSLDPVPTESLVVLARYMKEGTLEVDRTLSRPATPAATEPPAGETSPSSPKAGEAERPATETATPSAERPTKRPLPRPTRRHPVRPTRRLPLRPAVTARSAPIPLAGFRLTCDDCAITTALRGIEIGDLTFDWEVVQQRTNSGGVKNALEFGGVRCGDITIRLQAREEESLLAERARAVAQGTDTKMVIELEYFFKDGSMVEFKFQDCELIRWSPREHDPSNETAPVMETFVVRVGSVEIYQQQ